MKLLNIFVLISVVGAFAPPNQQTAVKQQQQTASSSSSSSSLKMSEEPLSDLQSKVTSLVSNINADGITGNLDVIKSNTLDGSIGSRGEVYAIAQFAILACILGGGIPIVGDILMLVLGPGLFIAGAGVLFVGTNDLGANLSPWPVPPANAQLQTNGLYGEMRHPMYAGLLAACAGLSIVSGSATRLLLTAVLFYGLEIKSNYEEAELGKTFPDYAAYKETVTSKFFPESIIQELPWMKNE